MQPLVLQQNLPVNWTGFTTKAHLGALRQIEPQRANDLTTLINQVNTGEGLKSLLGQFPVLELPTDDDFIWRLQGDSEMNVPLVACYVDGAAITAASEAGKGGTKFTLVFPIRYFSWPLVIVGEKNEKYPVNITNEPTPNGTNWDYECELLTGDQNLYIPYEELVAGKLFSMDFTVVEKTMSKRGSEPHYTSAFEMRNTFSMIRMQRTIPANMLNRPVAFSWVDDSGRELSTWEEYEEYESDRQMEAMENKYISYGRSNKDSAGKYSQKGLSGFSLELGAGIRQQMETSNTYYYNNFSVDKILDAILDISIGKIPENNRQVLLVCGERGLIQFSEGLSTKASLYTPLTDPTRIKFGKNNELTFRGQFKRWEAPNGVVITATSNMMYDDTVRNKTAMPNMTGPAESYRYDIYYLGTQQAPNIQKVVKKGESDGRAYIPGIGLPPALQQRYTSMGYPVATGVHGLEYHSWSTLGAKIQDPTKTASFIPAILS